MNTISEPEAVVQTLEAVCVPHRETLIIVGEIAFGLSVYDLPDIDFRSL